MTQTIPSGHPTTPLQALRACAVFFHPGSDEVEQGFFMVADPRGKDTHHCIRWDIEEWAGLSVPYDADEHLSACLVKWPGEPDSASFFDFSEAELEFDEGSIISIPKNDKVVVVGEDIDFESGSERARALVIALAEVSVANQKGGR